MRKIDRADEAQKWLTDLARTNLVAVSLAKMLAEGCPDDMLIGEAAERYTEEEIGAMLSRACDENGISAATCDEVNAVSSERRKILTDRACAILGITPAGRRTMGLEQRRDRWQSGGKAPLRASILVMPDNW
jgi:hypothetical protein